MIFFQISNSFHSFSCLDQHNQSIWTHSDLSLEFCFFFLFVKFWAFLLAGQILSRQFLLYNLNVKYVKKERYSETRTNILIFIMISQIKSKNHRINFLFKLALPSSFIQTMLIIVIFLCKNMYKRSISHQFFFINQLIVAFFLSS